MCRSLATGQNKDRRVATQRSKRVSLAGTIRCDHYSDTSGSVLRPDGIVSMEDLRETIAVKDAESPIKYPYPKLNEMLKGSAPGLITLAAGSGGGKKYVDTRVCISDPHGRFHCGDDDVGRVD